MKKLISLIVGVPAMMIFAGECGAEYIGLQLACAGVLVALFMWNVNFGENKDVR